MPPAMYRAEPGGIRDIERLRELRRPFEFEMFRIARQDPHLTSDASVRRTRSCLVVALALTAVPSCWEDSRLHKRLVDDV